MATNLQNYEAAMDLTRERVTNCECPCCGRSEWWDSATFGIRIDVLEGVMTPDVAGGVLGVVPPEFADEGPDVFGLKPGFQTALAFACKWCGYLRFHRFEEE